MSLCLMIIKIESKQSFFFSLILSSFCFVQSCPGQEAIQINGEIVFYFVFFGSFCNMKSSSSNYSETNVFITFLYFMTRLIMDQ